jgi:hypothetical protein
MGGTYESIASQTLTSAAASITFSSIPATFTDLRLVLSATVSSAGQIALMQFNGDTATNYSYRHVEGNGATTSSSSAQTQSSISLATGAGLSLTIPVLHAVDIFQYKNTGMFKTALVSLAGDQNGSGNVRNSIGLWRSTAAITSLVLSLSAGNFAIGTTAELIGISNA